MAKKVQIKISEPSESDIKIAASLRKKDDLDYKFCSFSESGDVWLMHYMLSSDQQGWMKKLDYDLSDDILLTALRRSLDYGRWETTEYLLNLTIERDMLTPALDAVAREVRYHYSHPDKIVSWLKAAEVVKEDFSEDARQSFLDTDYAEITTHLIEVMGCVPNLTRRNYLDQAIGNGHLPLTKMFIKKYGDALQSETDAAVKEKLESYIQNAYLTAVKKGKSEFINAMEGLNITLDFSALKVSELAKLSMSALEHFSDKGIDVFAESGISANQVCDYLLENGGSSEQFKNLQNYGLDLNAVTSEVLLGTFKNGYISTLKIYQELTKEAGVIDKIEELTVQLVEIAFEQGGDKRVEYAFENAKLKSFKDCKIIKDQLEKENYSNVKRLIDAALYDEQNKEVTAKLWILTIRQGWNDLKEKLDKLPLDRFDVTVDENDMLYRAIENHDIERVKVLVQAGADVTDRDGKMLIYAATTKDKPEMARYLLRVADGKLDKYVDKTISQARYRDRYDIVSFLSNLPKWEIMNEGEISYTSSFENGNSKLKKVFNFYAGTVTSIYENVKDQTQHVETRNFNEFQLDGDIKNAYKRLQEDGVSAPEYLGHRFQQGATGDIVASPANVNRSKVNAPAPSGFKKQK